MKYFGEAWNSMIAQQERVETPQAPCHWCNEDIVEGEKGLVLPGSEGDVPFHQECFLRQIVGSVNHQQGICSCFGGVDEDPAGLSVREAAKAAVKLFEDKNRA